MNCSDILKYLERLKGAPLNKDEGFLFGDEICVFDDFAKELGLDSNVGLTTTKTNPHS